MLNFEAGDSSGAPRGWGGGPAGTLFADDQIVHGGKWAARLERKDSSNGKFSTLTNAVPISFAGKRIELRGFLKSDAVSGYFGMWLREDGDDGQLGFDNMQNRQLKGTTDWTEYSIILPLNPDAKTLVFGFLMEGTGKTWADDLQLLVDGTPVWNAPKFERPQTALDRDHQFDRGSTIAFDAFSAAQIENLVTLGKVWGFLKYHHPGIAAGERHWDYDLFRVLPKILAAPDRTAAAVAIREWIASLGPVKDCAPCASLDTADLYMPPDVEWISDEKRLGAELSRDLRNIFKNRPAKSQFYVSLEPNVWNPKFLHESAYAAFKSPDPGYQLLALYRLWNIVEYWSPNRDILGEDWDGVLKEFIPKVSLAKTAEAYKLEMMALIAEIHDTHASLWSSIGLRPPVGECRLPVTLRFIEDRAVVTGFSLAGAEVSTGLQRGDVISDLDGTPVRDLVQRWTPLYAASNDAARLRDIAGSMTRGECGPSAMKVLRSGESVSVSTPRVSNSVLDFRAGSTHDLPGDAFRKLSNDVAYLKLSAVKASESAHYIEQAEGTKGLIIDIRNYPSQFVVFTLGPLLIDKISEFARFTWGDLANPGAFHWGPPTKVPPMTPHYEGKVVILVDEVTQSSAEYHSMVFRAAPHATVIGSTTAGADGNVSQIPLPGGLSTMISGIGVFYPDKKPTQRIGIVPDIVVKPTIAGIREGRDEVLEAAIRRVLGPIVPEFEIRALAKP
jgi:peptidase S41-like protein